MTLPLNYDLPSVVTRTPVSKMFKCQKKDASLSQWNEECYCLPSESVSVSGRVAVVPDGT